MQRNSLNMNYGLRGQVFLEKDTSLAVSHRHYFDSCSLQANVFSVSIKPSFPPCPLHISKKLTMLPAFYLASTQPCKAITSNQALQDKKCCSKYQANVRDIKNSAMTKRGEDAKQQHCKKSGRNKPLSHTCIPILSMWSQYS